MTGDLTSATIWREALAMPETLRETLDRADGLDDVAALLSAPGTRRIVATGNGASWYAAIALQLAALLEPRASVPEVLAAPGGMLAGRALAWRDGDVLLAFSTSGEFRDVVGAIQDDACPQPFALVTGTPDSTLGRAAGARSLVRVRSQDAVTHTQGYGGNVLTALALWARIAGDDVLGRAVDGAPEVVARALEAAPEWAGEALDGLATPPSAVCLGTGPGWAAALEAALLLGEIALVPSQGVETREGATTAMYPLAPGHLVLSLPTGPDPLIDEAEATCARRGATVRRVPALEGVDPRLAALAGFPAPLALATAMALRDGNDPDQPGWQADYLATARASAPSGG